MQWSIAAPRAIAGATDNGVPTRGLVSPDEDLLHGIEPATRSTELIRRAGQRLGLDQRVIEAIIHPHEVRVFRLTCHILGRPIVIPGVMALHNNARGPYKGGIRLAPDVSLWETVELARLMTFKTALAGIEFGGAKSSLRVPWDDLYRTFRSNGATAAVVETAERNGNGRSYSEDLSSTAQPFPASSSFSTAKHRDPEFEKMVALEVIEAFARQFRETFLSHAYIPAPDMGTSADEMTMIYNETLDAASVTGKAEGTPGWLPGRRESTGYGCACVTLRLMREVLGEDPTGRTVAIQGFGNVGEPLARNLIKHGVHVTAVTDASGGLYDPSGLDVEALAIHVRRTGTIAGFDGQPIENGQLLALPVDVLIPAAMGSVIDAENAHLVQARAIVEAANMPVTLDAMSILARRGIPVMPDILANAGGVIASMEEYSRSLSAVRLPAEAVLREVEATLDTAFDQCLVLGQEEKIPFIDAAFQIGLDRVWKAMRSRRQV
jgi:glutamate dehydrogenase/leucine dehydrogenase